MNVTAALEVTSTASQSTRTTTHGSLADHQGKMASARTLLATSHWVILCSNTSILLTARVHTCVYILTLIVNSALLNLSRDLAQQDKDSHGLLVSSTVVSLLGFPPNTVLQT